VATPKRAGTISTSSGGSDKRFHGWGQSESGIAGLIERFTLPGHFVLDPFMGGATTGVVALRMGRAFIGIDNDGNAVETARARLAA
jgi:DNA methylase